VTDRTKRRLRAIVFDFDGVIANSEPLHFGAMRDVLAEDGIVLSKEAYYSSYLGYDDRGAFRAIGADQGVSFSSGHLADLLARKAVRLEQLERDASVLFPGAADAVRRAAAAVPIAIASGALRAEILRVLDRADLTHLFSVIVGAEDAMQSKPAPDPYVRAVSLLSAVVEGAPLQPSECVAIEDSRWGLQSARDAGLRTVGVTHTYSASELGGAELVLSSLDALDLDQLRRLWR
jgi:HAD superfamily hydrolase (TIGR01509 family)